MEERAVHKDSPFFHYIQGCVWCVILNFGSGVPTGALSGSDTGSGADSDGASTTGSKGMGVSGGSLF